MASPTPLLVLHPFSPTASSLVRQPFSQEPLKSDTTLGWQLVVRQLISPTLNPIGNMEWYSWDSYFLLSIWVRKNLKNILYQ